MLILLRTSEPAMLADLIAQFPHPVHKAVPGQIKGTTDHFWVRYDYYSKPVMHVDIQPIEPAEQFVGFEDCYNEILQIDTLSDLQKFKEKLENLLK